MRAVVVSLLVLPLLVRSGSLSAQEPPPIEPGARVRVTVPDFGLEKSVGTCLALSNGSMQFLPQSGPSPRTIPVTAMTRLQVSRGRKSHIVGGAVLGGLTGAVVGGTVVILGTQLGCETTGGCSVDWGEGGRWIALFSVIGVAFGGGIGALVKTDRWEEVPLDRLRVSLAPQRDGRFALGVYVAF